MKKAAILDEDKEVYIKGEFIHGDIGADILVDKEFISGNKIKNYGKAFFDSNGQIIGVRGYKHLYYIENDSEITREGMFKGEHMHGECTYT